MKVTSLFSVFDEHDVFFATGSGVDINTSLFLRGDIIAMERLAKAAIESARIQRSQAQLPSSDLPAPERQPRERGVQCAKCRGDAWTIDAICPRCADRHCQHCGDPVMSVEGGLIHTTNGTVHCDQPSYGPGTKDAA